MAEEMLGREMPPNAAIPLDTKATIQQYTSDFTGLLIQAVVERCNLQKQKMASRESVIDMMESLGLENLVEPVRAYLIFYREFLRELDAEQQRYSETPKNRLVAFPEVREEPQPPAQLVEQQQGPYDWEYDEGKLIARMGDFYYPALGDVQGIEWRKLPYEANRVIEDYSSEFGLLISHRAAVRCELQGRDEVSSDDVREVMASLQMENDEDQPLDAYLRWYHQTLHAGEEVAGIGEGNQ